MTEEPKRRIENERRTAGLGFMVVADFTNLILRHVQTSKTCCRLVLIYNRFVDLQQNRRFMTTMNPDPDGCHNNRLSLQRLLISSQEVSVMHSSRVIKLNLIWDQIELFVHEFLSDSSFASSTLNLPFPSLPSLCYGDARSDVSLLSSRQLTMTDLQRRVIHSCQKVDTLPSISGSC